MAPTYIKGGVWTNVEDEILKAAISKYGLNQWARVSSLLARKTAKQVKARWNEWLDPTIKKIEWSREEDEKLLNLAKLMPSQWRSIAPIVGRTATQCIERYQKLLDDAEQKESSTDLQLSGVGADASEPVASGSIARRFRAGDIDPTPESKPARPDAIDMDEDEKEMLSEARARLANTQGKKAKRKDRERILAESNRLALLQKRRELKQAGINTKIKRLNKTGIDYNQDIPFEHKPAIGIYDISDEKDANFRQKSRFDKLMLRKGIFISNDKDKDKSENKKKRANENNGEAKESAVQQAALARAEKLQQLNQAEQIAKRRKLELPAPQVRGDELEQIIKHGRRADLTKELYSGDQSATGELVGEYDEGKNMLIDSMRTPAMSSTEDHVYRATKDLRNLTESQSSLLGEENTPLYDSSFSSRTLNPQRPTMQTPNPLALRTPSARGASQTPMRDALGMNAVGVGATPREVLRQGFLSLPKPKNDFEIVLPDQSSNGSMNESSFIESDVAEDAGERQRRVEEQMKLELEKELKRRSKVLQKGLPRPTNEDILKLSLVEENDPFVAIKKEIENEMRKLILSDNAKYPIEEWSTAISSEVLPELHDDIRSQIEQEIEQEAGSRFKNSTFGKLFEEYLDGNGQEKVLPGMESYVKEDATDLLTSRLTDIAEKSNKTEDKLKVVFGGYMKRQAMLSSKVSEAHEALVRAQTDYKVFSELRDMEEIGISSRLSALQEEVNFLSDGERAAQERYRSLVAVKQSVLANGNGTTSSDSTV